MEYLIFISLLPLLFVSYKQGVKKGRRDVIDALNIPDGCEIASINFRPLRNR